ncbi:MAG: DUF6794 domain-containing protein [Saprospiraceae bacterium]
MIKFQKLLFLSIFIGAFGLVVAQTPKEFEANYAKRIKLEMINGVYIPVDLEDAFSELTRLSDAAGIANFKNAPDSLIAKSHFGLVKWVQLNWGLDEGSRLSHYLKLKGISVPDDMARVIVLLYHRHLNGQPLMFEAEVAKIAKRMDLEKMKRDSTQVIKIIEKRPHKE